MICSIGKRDFGPPSNMSEANRISILEKVLPKAVFAELVPELSKTKLLKLVYLLEETPTLTHP